MARLGWLSAVVLLAGCGGNGSGPRLCARGADPSATLEQACLGDDDCACGSHCDLGLCVADCRADGDCTGADICDPLGRCRAEGTSAVIPPVPDASAPISLTPSLLFMAPDTVYRFDVVAGGAVGRVRLVAPEGAEVSCEGPEGPFGRHCLVEPMEPGARPVHVRLDGAAMAADPTPRSVYVHGPEGVRELTAALASAAPGPGSGDAPAAGVFEGVLQLMAVGADGAEPETGGPTILATDVGAEVHALDGSTYRVALHDAVHLLGPSDDFVFEVAVASDGAVDVTTSDQRYLEGTEAQALARFEPQRAGFRAGALQLDFDQRLSGVLAGRDLVARWRLVLRRADDLPAGAAPPDLPAPQTLPEDPADRAATRLPWESAPALVIDAPTVPFSGLGGDALWQCETSVNIFQVACDALWASATARSACLDAASASPPAILCDQGGSNLCGTASADFGCTVQGSNCVFCDPDVTPGCEPVSPAPLADPVRCAEIHLCWQPPASPDGSITELESRPLVRDLLLPYAIYGDLRCADVDISAALGMTAAADAPLVERPTQHEMLESCADDLERALGAPPAVSTRNAVGLAELSGDAADCVDARRMMPALTWALRRDLERALDDTGAPPAPIGAATTLGHRLVYQWAQIATFVAEEATQSDQLQAILTVDGAPIEPNDRLMHEYLDLASRALRLALHPRIATALANAPGVLVAEPDYRTYIADSPLPRPAERHHEQALPAASALAEAAEALLSASRELVERGQRTLGDPDVTLDIAGRNARTAVALLALSEAMTRGAEARGPRWQPHHDAARSGARAELSLLALEGQRLAAGRNPFGVEDVDLPLYFLGDPGEADRRFAAVSDNLVGTSASMFSDAWAPATIARASGAFEAAREEWLAIRERQAAQTITSVDADRRLSDLAASFGEQVIAMCGRTDWSPTTILDEWTGEGEYSSGSCYVSQTPECLAALDRLRSAPTAEAVTGDDAALAICVARSLNPAGNPDAVSGFPELDALLAPATRIGAVSRGGNDVEVSTGGATLRFAATNLYQLPFQANQQELSSAATACGQRYPEGRFPLPTPEDVGEATFDASCAAGGLGDAALDLQASMLALNTASASMEENLLAFEIATRSCLLLEEAQNDIQTLMDVRFGLLTGLRSLKLVADIAHLTADTLMGTLEKEGNLLVTTKGAITAAAVTSIAAGSASLGLEFAIDEAIDGYDLEITAREFELELDQCFNDARQNLVAMRSASQEFEEALFARESAIGNLLYLQDRLDQIVRGARSELTRERERIETVDEVLAPLVNEQWINERVTTFVREMHLARRTTFLAVRAVEYEFQASLMARADVLAAHHPDELAAVQDELLGITGTRSIAGARPTDLVTVLSLRRDILPLSDRGGYPSVERFRSYLTRPEHAVHDASGFVGYRVPFRLMPSGNEAPGTIPIFAQNDCAERLWTVSASILGDAPYIGEDPPTFARIDILKRNTFMSQWCDDSRDDLQVASVRPGRNLFSDPAYGTAAGIGVGDAFDPDGFSRARLRAFLNVDRGALELDDYAEGDSLELAGRGLYGDYALFVPAGVISDSGNDGLALDRIDDILLRLEYVSASR